MDDEREKSQLTMERSFFISSTQNELQGEGSQWKYPDATYLGILRDSAQKGDPEVCLLISQSLCIVLKHIAKC